MYTREVRYLSCVHGMIEMKMNFVLALTTSVVRFGVCRHLWPLLPTTHTIAPLLHPLRSFLRGTVVPWYSMCVSQLLRKASN